MPSPMLSVYLSPSLTRYFSLHHRYSGAFFPDAKHFVVAGGKFKSITNIQQAAPSTPPDFRVVPLGDLNLVRRIGSGDGNRVEGRRRGLGFVRRMYTARIHGSKSTMIAAVYQGDGAEQRWREDMSRYPELRHPNLFQLYGIVSTPGLYATVFHDDLIPCAEIQDRYRNFHFATVFFWACMGEGFRDVREYIQSVSGRYLHWSQYRAWIRLSTGCLSLDLTPAESDSVGLVYLIEDFALSGTSLLEPCEDWEVITSISLQDYHLICSRYLSHWQFLSISSPPSVKLGSIHHLSGSKDKSSSEIAVCPDCGVYDLGWSTIDPIVANCYVSIDCTKEGISIMENGWIRVHSTQVANGYSRQIHNYSSRAWLAQANYIFDCLDITSNFEDYGIVERVRYEVELLEAGDTLPPGYLFLCPFADLLSDSPASLKLPDCPAYWSPDPNGFDRPSSEKARTLGFPAMVFHMDVYAVSWDHSVYAGIRQFHQARGFDPYSQEVAAALGYPLLHVHWEEDARFADMQENDSGDHYSDTDGVSDSQDVSESGDEKSESDNSVSADSLLIQEADISASHQSSSTQEIISDHEETLRLPDGLDKIDEQYVVNTSIIWGGSVGNPSSWNDNPWE